MAQDSECTKVTRLLKGALKNNEQVTIVKAARANRVDALDQLIKAPHIIEVGVDSIDAIEHEPSIVLMYASNEMSCDSRILNAIVTQYSCRVVFVTIAALNSSIIELVDELGSFDHEDTQDQSIDPIKDFARLFLALEVEAEGEPIPSRAVMDVINRITGFDVSPPLLVKTGWLVGARTGSRITGYNSSDYLRALIPEHEIGPEPLNPYDRAQRLIDSEPAVQESISHHESQLKILQGKMRSIHDAREWINAGSQF